MLPCNNDLTTRSGVALAVICTTPTCANVRGGTDTVGEKEIVAVDTFDLLCGRWSDESRLGRVGTLGREMKGRRRREEGEERKAPLVHAY